MANDASYIRRIIAGIIDWNIIWLISFLPLLFNPLENNRPSIKDFGTLLLIFILFFAFSLFKDLTFRNASIGKKLLNIKVVKAGTEDNASVSSMILRNITFLIASIEIIVLFVNKKRRLGDLLAKTQVVKS